MATTLTIHDETTSGTSEGEIVLEFLTERITVRELIRSRVYQEVKDHNIKDDRHIFRGLVQPSDAERVLNGYRMRQARQLDWQKQYEIAIEGFKRNGFIVLVDKHQAEDLDEEIVIQPETRVSFLKLVPLVGG